MFVKKFVVAALTVLTSITFAACNNTKTLIAASAISYGEYRFPVVGLGTLLPVPESNRGEIIENGSTYFYLDVAETSEEQFDSYLEKCIEAGFIFDYSKYCGHYYVFHYDIYELIVFYEDDIMSIDINTLMNKKAQHE